ncbi:MAG: carboxypeptidase-like regulatory domain-containing protein, partial [Ferruginibacter sp.]
MKKLTYPLRVSRAFFIFCLSMLVSSFSFSQAVTGTVTDDGNKSLSGVTVTVKGANRSVVTNIDGNFNIIAQSGEKLVFSYVGFATQEVTVTDKKNYPIT